MPVEDCVKLPVTVAVPIELPGAMTPELARLPTTLPMPDQVPMLTTLPVTVPLLVNEPAVPLMTEPVNVPVFVAVATLARLPRNALLLVNVPWIRLPHARRVHRAVVDEAAARIDREVAGDRARAGRW